MKKLMLSSVLAVSLLTSSCASVNSPTYEEDPLEPLNRGISAFNDVVDTFILTPLVYVYKTVTPPIVQVLIGNVTSNLREPISTINYALQGEGEKAGMSLGRFMTNSVLGIGGLMDVASHAGIPNNKTTFGTTLAKWGVTESPYFVFPFVGPSTVRDSVGIVAGWFMHPTNMTALLSGEEFWIWFDWSRFGVEVLNTRADYLSLTDDIKRNSIDSYAMMRTMYLQNRRHELEQELGISLPSNGNGGEGSGYDFDMEDDDGAENVSAAPATVKAKASYDFDMEE